MQDGGAQQHQDVVCINKKSTKVDGVVIAAQCCDTEGQGEFNPTRGPQGDCYRYVGSENDAGCIAGDPPRPYTFDQLLILCAELGFTPCPVDCEDTGCGYNPYPVWTGVPCECPPE